MNRLELSADRVDALVNLPQVADARKQLADSSVVYFSAELSPELCEDLAAMGVSVPPSSAPSVPLRWIRGDTPAHVDTGADAFERTHLVYLTDSEGEFLLDGVSYPITKGSGFTFDHGISHGTRGTGSTPRLLLGPMSEQAASVGTPRTIDYYSDYTNAQTDTGTGVIAYSETSFIVGQYDSGNNGNYTAFLNAYVAGTIGSPVPTAVGAVFLINDPNLPYSPLESSGGAGSYTYNLAPITILYYTNSTDAIAANGNYVAHQYTSYLVGSPDVGSIGGTTVWQIANSFDGSSSGPVVNKRRHQSWRNLLSLSRGRNPLLPRRNAHSDR